MNKREFIKRALDYIALFGIAIVASSVIGVFRAPKEPFDLSLIANKTTLSGKRVSDILDLKKPTIVHFWGVWCPVCRQEIDTINDLSKRDDINLITVAVNSGFDVELREWMQKRGVDFEVINDISGILASKAGVNVFPTTLYYDSKGNMKFADSGYTTYAGFVARIELLK